MRKKICLTLLFLMLLVFLLTVISDNGVTSAVPGYTSPIFPEAWQQTIVHGANQEAFKLSVNGETVEADLEEPFITNDSKLMLPLSWIHKAFPVMTVEDPDGKVTLLYGRRKLEFMNDEDTVLVDGESVPAAAKMRILNGMLYLSSDLLQETMNIHTVWGPDRNSMLFTTDPETEALPEKFSLADYGKLPEVQDQGKLGACAAFAALSALESERLPKDHTVFSRDHLLIYEGLDLEEEAYGGTPSQALAYLLSWEGPVDGAKDPYGDGKTVADAKTECHVEGAYQMTAPDTETLKEACFRYGGVEATMYLRPADKDNAEQAENEYNEEAAAYCCLEQKDVNHDVVIVGWDDSFPKNSFPCGDRLTRDGAFICLNSWGKEFGQNGLFYVSYEDASFAPYAMAYTEVEDADSRARIYQTDLMGPAAQAGYGGGDAWFANVYTAESREIFTGAGFYTLGESSEYDLYIVRDFQDIESFSKKQLLKSGRLTYSGFHTVRLKEELRLEKGESFAVLVHLKTEGVNFPVAVTAAPEGADSSAYGYLGSSGSSFKSTKEQGSISICLKAYTKKQ